MSNLIKGVKLHHLEATEIIFAEETSLHIMLKDTWC